MSVPQKATVTCSKCKNTYEATIWGSVNTDLREGLPQEIISGQFFASKCPHCGAETHLIYDMLYHDMRHSVMIWVVNEEADAEGKIKEIRETAFLTPNYTTRIVRSIEQLREKVAIIEAGRDDRIIEILKFVLFSQGIKEFPDMLLDGAAYVSAYGKEHIVFQTTGGDSKWCILDQSVYKKLVWQFEDFLNELPTTPYQVIDENWGINTFELFQGYIETTAAQEDLTTEQVILRRILEKENEELYGASRKASTQNPLPKESSNTPSPKKKKSKDEFVPGLGMGWYKFYTKVRPILACIFTVIYLLAYIDNFAILINFNAGLTAILTIIFIGGSIAYVALNLMLAIRSSEAQTNTLGAIEDQLFKFIRLFLIFETIFNIYNYALEQYYYGKNFMAVATSTLIAALLWYFLWYRLNMRYFRRRRMPEGVSNIDTPETHSVAKSSGPKKGVARIVIGLVLVLLQILSIAGSSKAGNSLPSLNFSNGQTIMFSLFSCLGYWIWGIGGLALVISGGVAFNRSTAQDFSKVKTDIENEVELSSNPQNMLNEPEVDQRVEMVMDETVADAVEKMGSELPQIKFCRKCGSRLMEGARFCSQCGTEIQKR